MEQTLIEYIVKSIVNEPDAVQTTVVERDRVKVIELRVAEGDEGRIIGKRGAIAKSIRTILQAAASKSNRRFALEILD